MLQYLYRSQADLGGDADGAQAVHHVSRFLVPHLRFGLNEAHGKGMAMQVNLSDRQRRIRRRGRMAVRSEFRKDQVRAVRDLDHDLLTIEATGDYAGAKRMLDQLGVIRPEMQKALNNLTDIPVDIEPRVRHREGTGRRNSRYAKIVG